MNDEEKLEEEIVETKEGTGEAIDKVENEVEQTQEAVAVVAITLADVIGEMRSLREEVSALRNEVIHNEEPVSNTETEESEEETLPKTTETEKAENLENTSGKSEHTSNRNNRKYRRM